MVHVVLRLIFFRGIKNECMFSRCVGLCFSIPSCESCKEDTPTPEACSVDNGGCGDATYYSCTNNEGAAATCADIDECATDNGGCDANATCTNTVGSYECACDSGYNGDDFTCALSAFEDFETGGTAWEITSGLAEQNANSDSSALHLWVTDSGCQSADAIYVGAEIPSAANGIRFDWDGDVADSDGIRAQVWFNLGDYLGLPVLPISGPRTDTFCLLPEQQGTSVDFKIVLRAQLTCANTPNLHLWIDNITFLDDVTDCIPMSSF